MDKQFQPLTWELAEWNDPILAENLERRIEDDKKWLEKSV